MNRKTLWALVAGLSLSTTHASEPPTDFNEDILIFTGEVENYIDIARETQSLNNSEETPGKEEQVEKQIKSLQQAALRIAHMYFSTSDESTRDQFNEFLSSRFQENRDLKNYFLFIGNGFAAEASRLIEKRQETNRQIFIWSSVAGGVLGLGGGYLILRYTSSKSLVMASVVAIGIGVAVAGGGYSARYYLPVNQDVKNAQDFIDRYPHGEDFTDELIGSNDLALMMDALEGEDQ